MTVDPNLIPHLVEELGDRRRAVPASAFCADGPDASRSGVDGWWADHTARRLIGETLGADASSLIYVGGAGGGESSQTLATRVFCKHLNGSVSDSTLRRSLTAILMETSAFAAGHADPQVVRRSPTLSAWMREHLQVAIIPVERAELGDAERTALSRYDPPLNLQNVPDPDTPARTKLKELRHRL